METENKAVTVANYQGNGTAMVPSVAIGIVGGYVISRVFPDVPTEVVAAIVSIVVTILTAGTTFLYNWLKYRDEK